MMPARSRRSIASGSNGRTCGPRSTSACVTRPKPRVGVGDLPRPLDLLGRHRGRPPMLAGSCRRCCRSTPAPGRARGTLLWVSALLDGAAGRALLPLAGWQRRRLRSVEPSETRTSSCGHSRRLGVAAYMDRRWDDAVSVRRTSRSTSRDSMAFRFAALSAKVMLVSTHAYSDRASMRRSQRPTMRSP